MDLKALFHNPEDLSEADLSHLRDKIRMQRSMPWVSSIFFGYGVFLLDRAIIKRSHDIKRIALGAFLGFALGAYGSYHVQTSLPSGRKFDHEIMNAFDRRYMTTVLNATGFGSNYVSPKDYSDSTAFKKPY